MGLSPYSFFFFVQYLISLTIPTMININMIRSPNTNTNPVANVPKNASTMSAAINNNDKVIIVLPPFLYNMVCKYRDIELNIFSIETRFPSFSWYWFHF